MKENKDSENFGSVSCLSFLSSAKQTRSQNIINSQDADINPSLEKHSLLHPQGQHG